MTGGGTGICRGIALALASAGCNVAISSRKQEHLEPAAAEIRRAGVKALAIAGDVRDPAAVDAVVTQSENEPFPEPLTALEDVYANPAVVEPLWYRNG